MGNEDSRRACENIEEAPSSCKVITSKKEAKSKGLKRYFTGRLCKRGHISERYTGGGNCCECAALKVRTWRAENPEWQLHLDREYKRKNRAKINAQYRARYALDPEKHVEKVKLYYRANSEKVRKRRREYHYKVYVKPEVREAAAFRTRQWAQDNPERARNNARVSKHNRRALELSASGSFTAEDVSQLFALQSGRCLYCKKKLGEKYHIDHKIALARGGTNDRSNLQLLCAKCNMAKGARDPIKHVQSLGMLIL